MNGLDGIQRQTVLDVLRAHGVDIAEAQVKGQTGHTLVKGEVVESQLLPEIVPRTLLHRFARRFDIPIAHFWHPEMALGPRRLTPSPPGTTH